MIAKAHLFAAAAAATLMGSAYAQDVVMPEGDPAAGENVFRRCMACHAVQEGQNRVGPSLYGVVGRPAGAVEGYRYSKANAESGVTWTKEELFQYLEDSVAYMQAKAPDAGRTKMIFKVPDPQDRADVIAYLATIGPEKDGDGAEDTNEGESAQDTNQGGGK